jgi:membrane protease YdiL (CAAX protease family)
MTRLRRTTTALGLLLTLGLGSLPFPMWLDQFASTAHLLAVEAVYWVLVVATLLHVRCLERRPLGSVGLQRPGWRTATRAVAIAIVTIVGLAGIVLVLFPALGLDETGQIERLRQAPTWWLLISVVRAGVMEELAFRGYALERLRESIGSTWLAALATWAVFTLAHIGSWSWAHLWIAGYGGAVLTLAYVWRRDLLANMLAHALVDAVAVFA